MLRNILPTRSFEYTCVICEGLQSETDINFFNPYVTISVVFLRRFADILTESNPVFMFIFLYYCTSCLIYALLEKRIYEVLTALPQPLDATMLVDRDGTCNTMPGWDPLSMWNPVPASADPDCKLNPMYQERGMGYGASYGGAY
mmetsp:Transcript_11330/g.24338  ORF Transcript_11330/g.24338 Transcript_11330/m.24338 type:complete len:144 (-) Transcript_11330:228-659(-)